jgi:hypothetical protein
MSCGGCNYVVDSTRYRHHSAPNILLLRAVHLLLVRVQIRILWLKWLRKDAESTVLCFPATACPGESEGWCEGGLQGHHGVYYKALVE